MMALDAAIAGWMNRLSRLKEGIAMRMPISHALVFLGWLG
jgi:hypothetical protein